MMEWMPSNLWTEMGISGNRICPDNRAWIIFIAA